MAAAEQGPAREQFRALVAKGTVRPTTADALFDRLKDQLGYQENASLDGLEKLASAVALALTRGAAAAEPELRRLAIQHDGQPLCHFYLVACRLELGDVSGVRDALDGLERVDAGDPMVELFRLSLAGKPPPEVDEEVRLANIAKFADTPLLKNPYRLAVGAIFEAIRDRENARVLDVGIGSGAQMAELLDLLAREEHRVRRLEILGLDFVEDFLEAGGRSIRAAAERLDSRVDVAYSPVKGRIEALDDETIAQILQDVPLDAANATIALHEVPGEAKLEALRNLHRLAPRSLVIAEWNYLLENVLPANSVEFLFNIRRVVAAMAAALRERHPLVEARAVARDWMSMAAGQLTCSAADRQECFLDAPVWKLLLEHCGFDVIPPDPSLLGHAASPHHASVAEDGWYVTTSRYSAPTPIALLQARPRGSPAKLGPDA